jgi:hypothetical protein
MVGASGYLESPEAPVLQLLELAGVSQTTQRRVYLFANSLA